MSLFMSSSPLATDHQGFTQTEAFVVHMYSPRVHSSRIFLVLLYWTYPVTPNLSTMQWLFVFYSLQTCNLLLLRFTYIARLCLRLSITLFIARLTVLMKILKTYATKMSCASGFQNPKTGGHQESLRFISIVVQVFSCPFSNKKQYLNAKAPKCLAHFVSWGLLLIKWQLD